MSAQRTTAHPPSLTAPQPSATAPRRGRPQTLPPFSYAEVIDKAHAKQFQASKDVADGPKGTGEEETWFVDRFLSQMTDAKSSKSPSSTKSMKQ